MSKRLENIEKLMVHRANSWNKQDYIDAYKDEWDEIPYSLQDCEEKMEEHINHTYDDELIQDCIENEVNVEPKVTVAHVLNWHGDDHNIDELAKVLANILNGDYDPQLCKKEILDY